jgi:hypothetical protein
VYLLGIGMAFISPLLSLVLYAVVAVYYVFPTLPRATRTSEMSTR